MCMGVGGVGGGGGEGVPLGELTVEVSERRSGLPLPILFPRCSFSGSGLTK